MSERKQGEITRLLHDWRKGDSEAFEQLMPLVYTELRHIAAGLMRRERGDHTLQPTALLHELYFRLVQQQRGASEWGDRAHFFTFAAKLMRMILVDYARAHGAQRRGGDFMKLPLSDDLSWLGQQESDIIDLDRALEKLEQLDPRKARIVELRFFICCSVDEIAENLKISKATVDRDLKFIRGWIYRELRVKPPAKAAE